MSNRSDRVLHDERDRILTDWQAAATRGIAAGTVLGEILPGFLDSLIDANERNRVDSRRARTKRVRDFVATRLPDGVEIGRIVKELTLLGRAIVGSSIERPAEEACARERLGSLLELQDTIAVVVDDYVRRVAEDEIAERRLLLAMQQSVSEVSPELPRGKPLREQLERVLDVVLVATAADSAALAVVDPRHRTVLSAAGVGVAGDALEAAALGAVDTSTLSLPGAGRPRLGASVATDDRVAQPLRDAGVKTLVTIPLMVNDALAAAAYIAFAATRSIDARELRRVELLAEALALHIANADLLSGLRETIDDLESERALRDRFISLLAHDLRGPLTTARLTAESLGPEMPGGAAATGLARIRRSIDRADRMVRDLLDAMRIRAGHDLPLHFAEVNLGEVVRTVVADLGVPAGRIVVDERASAIGWWSSDELYRAIRNLVSNALKYGAPDRPVRVVVEQRGDDSAVTVHNKGASIPRDRHARLFEAFAQGDARGRHGWGLGLTLVAGCAKAHRGRVEVASSAADGTTFSLILPRDARPI